MSIELCQTGLPAVIEDEDRVDHLKQQLNIAMYIESSIASSTVSSTLYSINCSCCVCLSLHRWRDISCLHNQQLPRHTFLRRIFKKLSGELKINIEEIKRSRLSTSQLQLQLTNSYNDTPFNLQILPHPPLPATTIHQSKTKDYNTSSSIGIHPPKHPPTNRYLLLLGHQPPNPNPTLNRQRPLHPIPSPLPRETLLRLPLRPHPANPHLDPRSRVPGPLECRQVLAPECADGYDRCGQGEGDMLHELETREDEGDEWVRGWGEEGWGEWLG